jgi:hypothetical protein
VTLPAVHSHSVACSTARAGGGGFVEWNDINTKKRFLRNPVQLDCTQRRVLHRRCNSHLLTAHSALVTRYQELPQQSRKRSHSPNKRIQTFKLLRHFGS